MASWKRPAAAAALALWVTLLFELVHPTEGEHCIVCLKILATYSSATCRTKFLGKVSKRVPIVLVM